MMSFGRGLVSILATASAENPAVTHGISCIDRSKEGLSKAIDLPFVGQY